MSGKDMIAVGYSGAGTAVHVVRAGTAAYCDRPVDDVLGEVSVPASRPDGWCETCWILRCRRALPMTDAELDEALMSMWRPPADGELPRPRPVPGAPRRGRRAGWDSQQRRGGR